MTNTIPRNKKQLFDLWAPHYDSLFPSIFYQAIHKRLIESINLPHPANVLDLGCGTGQLLNRLAEKFPDLRGTGLDFSAEMIRQARHSNRHRPRLIYVQGNAMALPFADEQFNGVFNTISFLHYEFPDRVFQEVSRVLSAKGYFYLVDITMKRNPEPESASYIPVSPGGMRFYSAKAREQLGQKVGFYCLGHYYLLGPVLLTVFAKLPRL